MARLMSGVVATSADEDDEARYLRVNGECVHAPPPPLSYAFSLLPHLLLHLPPLKSDSFGTAARSSRHSFHFASTCHEEVAGRFFLSLSFRSRHASCWRSPAMWLRGNRARAWFDRYFQSVAAFNWTDSRSRLEFAANRGFSFRMVPVGCADPSETWRVSWVRQSGEGRKGGGRGD